MKYLKTLYFKLAATLLKYPNAIRDIINVVGKIVVILERINFPTKIDFGLLSYQKPGVI